MLIVREWATIHGQFIRLWDIYEKTLIYELKRYRLVISPNWKYIAALDANSTVLSWDIEKNRQILGTSKALTYRASKLVFSPSNRYLAIIRAGSISVIETENWTLYRKIRGKFPMKNIFNISYCGQKIAFRDSVYIYLVDTITSAKTIIYCRATKQLCLSFSPCGNYLALSPKENEGFILDLKTKNTFQIFAGFEGYILSVIFSISGKYICWSDSKGNIKIYEFSSKFAHNDNSRHLKIHKAKVSPKGTYLITSSSEKAILWELRTFNPKQIKQFMNFYFFGDYIFSPFETYLFRHFHGEMQIYDIKHDFWFQILNADRWGIFDYSFSHCENYLIRFNKHIYEYFSIRDMSLVRKINTRQQSSYKHKFSECGNYGFLDEPLNSISIWDLVKGDCMKKIQIEAFYSIYGLTSFLSQIAILVSRENTSFINVIKIDTEEIVCLNCEGEKIYSMCFVNTNRELLVVGYEKGIFKIWDIKTKTIKLQLRSLLARNINSVEAVNNHIIIKEKDNVEIFSLAQLS